LTAAGDAMSQFTNQAAIDITRP